MYVCMYIYMYVYIYIYMYICMYIMECQPTTIVIFGFVPKKKSNPSYSQFNRKYKYICLQNYGDLILWVPHPIIGFIFNTNVTQTHSKI